jgi:regulatory protein
MVLRGKHPPEPGSERESALRALSRREHSAAELKRKLERRGFGDEEASSAVDDLAARGLQSDARYAEMMVRSRVRQGFGPLRVRAELEAAGIPEKDATRALEESATDWNALAAKAQAQRFKALPDGAAGWQQQYRFLAHRGFEPEQIYAVLKAVAQD